MTDDEKMQQLCGQFLEQQQVVLTHLQQRGHPRRVIAGAQLGAAVRTALDEMTPSLVASHLRAWADQIEQEEQAGGLYFMTPGGNA